MFHFMDATDRIFHTLLLGPGARDFRTDDLELSKQLYDGVTAAFYA